MPAWMVYTLLTVLLWGVWGFEAKLLVDRASPYAGQVLFTFGLVVPLAVVLFSKRRFAGERRGRGIFYAFLTGLLGGGGNVAFYLALKGGSASTVVPLTSLSPLVTVLVGVVFLKERMSRRQYSGLALALVAIYLLSL
jgi:bacterial/archaeal transporter family protein